MVWGCVYDNLYELRSRFANEGFTMGWSFDNLAQRVHITVKPDSALRGTYGTWITFADTYKTEKMDRVFDNAVIYYSKEKEKKINTQLLKDGFRTRLKERGNITTEFYDSATDERITIHTERKYGDFHTGVERYIDVYKDLTDFEFDLTVQAIVEEHDRIFKNTYEGENVIDELRDHAIEATIDKVYHRGELEAYRIFARKVVTWCDEPAQAPKQYTCCVSELHERIKSDILLTRIIDLFDDTPDIYKIPARSGKTAAIMKYKGYEPIDSTKLKYVSFDELDWVSKEAAEKTQQQLVQAAFKFNFNDYNKIDDEAVKKFIDYFANKKEKENDSMNIAAQIKSVIFNNPAVIVMWKDGSKTVVKATNEEFDPEKGLAMAISKKVLGNKHEYYNVFKKYLKKHEKENK